VVAAGSAGATGVRSLRIVLAEDNPFNQQLMLALLSKWGHKALVAANGLEAVSLCDGGGRFDLVLMDVEMPVMDGLKATLAIRERERGRGGHIPIIAMTARALTGDRELCLAAGMDGYVSKPVSPEKLQAEMARLTPAPTLVPGGSPPDSPTDSMDMRPFLERVGGDRQVALEVAGTFVSTCPPMLAEIEAALAAGDATKLVAAAHRLAGSMCYFLADQQPCVAKEMEKAARQGDLASAIEMRDRLAGQLESLNRTLKAFSAQEVRQ